MLAICNADEPVAFKAPKTSLKDEKKVPQGKNLGAKSRRRIQIHVLLNHPQSKIDTTKGVSSSKEATGSPTGHSKKMKSSSSKDSNLSQPLASTPVVVGLHKEALKATCGLTSFRSALGHDASTDFTAKVYPRKSAPHDLIKPNLLEMRNQAKNLSKLVKEVTIDFMDLNSPEDDEPIIIQDEDMEEVHTKEVHAEKVHTKDTSASQPPSPKTVRIQELTELLVQSLKPELSKLLTSHDFSNSLPTKLKELPSKFKDINGEIKDLKRFPLFSLKCPNSRPQMHFQVYNSEEEDVPQAKIEKKKVKSSFAKIEFVKSKEQVKSVKSKEKVKSPRKTVNHVNQNRQNIHTPRGNQRNWNNMMSQRLGSNFKIINKACYMCGSFDHLQYDYDKH
ncbi:hypothetical protein Tco_0580972 [Tanacetum coccineum]